MRRMWIGTCVIASALLLFASDAAAQRGGREFRLGWISERLELDKETAAAVDAVVAETEPEAEALKRQTREEQRALNRLLEGDPPDVAAVMAQVERLGAAEIAADKHRVATLLRIRALLTPEQRAELASMGRKGPPPRVFEACKTDIESFCADIEPGRPAIRCLRDRRDQLSESCREAMPRRGHRGFRPPSDERRGRGDSPDAR